MRRLLLITTSYPETSASGKEAAGSFVADFAEELAKRVHTVVLAPGNATSGESANNLNVHRFAGAATPLSLLNAANPAHWPTIWTILRSGANSAEQLAQSYRFDHVLALWALPSGYWARRLKRRHGTPYSIWALGSDIWSLGRIPVVRHVLRTVLRDSRVNFADGRLLGEGVRRLSGRSCHFLPSLRHLPAPKNKQLRDHPPYRLAFLGRWHPNKGTDLLLDSLALLTDKDWQRIEEIRICGGGPLEPLVHARATALKDTNRPVNVGGFLDKTRAAELLDWADYLIIPSRIESIPVIFSDALQSTCPVISTPVGDLPRLIQEHHVGILAQDTSGAAIATAIRDAINVSPQSFAIHLEGARAQFSLPTACDEFLRLTDLASSHNDTNEPVSIQS